MTLVKEAMFSLEPCAASTPATSPSGPVAVWQPASASATIVMQAARPPLAVLAPVVMVWLRSIAGFPLSSCGGNAVPPTTIRGCRPCESPKKKVAAIFIAPPSSGIAGKRRKPGAGSARRGGAAAGDETFALGALAGELAGAANGLGLLAGALLGGLLVMAAHLHLAEDTFALH